MNILRQSCCWLICLVSLLLSGCGGGKPVVRGVVSLDGTPLPAGSEQYSGSVLFHPIGGGAKGVGSIDEDGHYTLFTGGQRGVAPGEYLVTVSVAEVMSSGEEGIPPYPRRITPARYASPKTSGFKYTVVPGKNRLDLELKSS